MRGDFGSRVREYRSFFGRAGISPGPGGKALDLGAGSGLQSAALADLGFGVLAVDSSEALLGELRARAGGRKVRAVLGDMRDPRAYAGEGPFEVAVCMGDTLSHLRSYEEAEALFADVRGALDEDGALVLEFRDYTVTLEGVDRAIPVRMEDDRIMVTFLEYGAAHVNVHDMVLERSATDGWAMRKSAYTKLRLETEALLGLLVRAGFRVASREEEQGLTKIIARA